MKSWPEFGPNYTVSKPLDPAVDGPEQLTHKLQQCSNQISLCTIPCGCSSSCFGFVSISLSPAAEQLGGAYSQRTLWVATHLRLNVFCQSKVHTHTCPRINLLTIALTVYKYGPVGVGIFWCLPLDSADGKKSLMLIYRIWQTSIDYF